MTKKTDIKKLAKTKKSSDLVSVPKPEKSKARKPKIDWDAMVVSATEMAELLDMTAVNVGALVKRGRLTRNADGTYNVGPTLRQYINNLRNRNEKESQAKEGEKETEYWRAAKLRQQSNEGRAAICEELLDTLLKVWRAAGGKVRAGLDDEAMRSFADGLFEGFENAVKTLDIMDIIGAVEVSGDEAEEGQDNPAAD